MTSPHSDNRDFRDDVVRVASLTVTDPTTGGDTLVNCRIVCPAVLAIIDGVEITHCTFGADVNALFQSVGFAGTGELRQAMESAVS